MKCITRILLWLAAVGLVLPQVPAVSAADLPVSARPNAASVTDVALTADGRLHGQLVDRAGAAKASARVSLFSGNQLVGQTTTDPQGRFAIQVQKGGVYRLTDDGTSKLVRTWTPAAAPPAAAPAVLLVGDRDVVRGQDGDGKLLGVMAAIGIAAGVTVAAVANNREGS